MPPDMDNDRFIYRIGADGEREVVAGTALVVEFGDGRELVVEFSNHPASRGGVMVRSEYFAPGAPRVPFGEQRAPSDEFAGLQIRPGGGNVMQVSVEVFARDDCSTLVAAGTVAHTMRLVAVDGKTRLGIGGRSAVMDLADGSDVTISFGQDESDAPRGVSRPSWASGRRGSCVSASSSQSRRRRSPGRRSSCPPTRSRRPQSRDARRGEHAASAGVRTTPSRWPWRSRSCRRCA